MAHQILIPGAEGGKHSPQDGQGRFPVQAFQHIAAALGNPHSPANGPAALGHHRIHDDVAVQGYADGPGGIGPVAQEQGIAAGFRPAAG